MILNKISRKSLLPWRAPSRDLKANGNITRAAYQSTSGTFKEGQEEFEGRER